jgi:hypothetical protein
MRHLFSVTSLVVLVGVVACSSGNGGTSTAGLDGGADGGGDGGGTASLCTRRPESERIQLCDPAGKNVLLACDPGAAPPSSECTKTTTADEYCCPAPAEPVDGGTDALPPGSYPTDHIGTTARQGNKAGDRIANATFQGYAAGSTTLGSVSFADLYDPTGKTHDVVVVVAGSLWDTFTAQTLTAVKGSTKRIATIAILGEGTSVGAPATLANLATWRATIPFATSVLDAGFAVMGKYFDAQAVPFVMFLDARTMEIAQAGVGAITATQDVDSAVTAITSRPPAY